MELETQHSQLPEEDPNNNYQANVDTSRPFRSVREAVAIFGDRLLLGEMYSSPKPNGNNIVQRTPSSSWKLLPMPANYKESEDVSSYGDEEENAGDKEVMDTLKKLEAELEETKVELKLLKERESETEVALASLNAELHKNMSKLAQAEANNAAMASNVLHVTARSSPFTGTNHGLMMEEEKNKREWMIRMEDSTSLAQILSIGTQKNGGGKREKKIMKKKPIVPLVQDLFFWKKGSSTPLRNPLFNSSPQLYY
ncbi:hypothetical protein PRUPE_1G577200 [Prunus persica]|uniref:WEB family protein n=1 Tax=Prunus persica TaxID=3760 RepID=M5Y9M4_PRUPE|nr:WEB family protein At3g51220 [Prunus persica]ONI36240.1 hypothetical protein PRUPE_1G577200 [Prunus persica]